MVRRCTLAEVSIAPAHHAKAVWYIVAQRVPPADDEVVRKTTLREVKMLRSLRHDNIVTLLEAFRRKQKLVGAKLQQQILLELCQRQQALILLQYLVFEYIEKNLLEVLEDSQSCLTPTQVGKCEFGCSVASCCPSADT